MTRVVWTKTWEDKIGTNRDENWAAFFMKSNWMTGQRFYLSNGIRTPKPRETPLASFLYVCFPIHLSEALLFRAKLWHLGCLSRKSSVCLFLSFLSKKRASIWRVKEGRCVSCSEWTAQTSPEQYVKLCASEMAEWLTAMLPSTRACFKQCVLQAEHWGEMQAEWRVWPPPCSWQSPWRRRTRI